MIPQNKMKYTFPLMLLISVHTRMINVTKQIQLIHSIVHLFISYFLFILSPTCFSK
jgi:hypothetical protein